MEEYMSYLKSILNPFIERSLDAYETKHDQLIDKWRATINMPRKLKKKSRKEIRLDWSINEHFGKMIDPLHLI